MNCGALWWSVVFDVRVEHSIWFAFRMFFHQRRLRNTYYLTNSRDHAIVNGLDAGFIMFLSRRILENYFIFKAFM